MNYTATDALLANNNNKRTNTNKTQQHIGVTDGGRTTHPEVTTDAKNTMVLLLKVPHQQHLVQHVLLSFT